MGSKAFDEIYKQYTAEELEQHKQDAFNYYKEKQGQCTVRVLSRKGKVPQGVIREWMKEGDWANKVKEDPGDKVVLSEETKDFISSHAEEYGLSEAEEIFCYHFLKTRNATASALRAGWSSTFSHDKAYKLLQKENIQRFLKDARAQLCREMFIDTMDIVDMYIKIAFADITDYVTFGPRGVQPKKSESVDGQLICKIKEGRDGVSIELADKMKALDKLSNYLGVTPQDVLDKVRVDMLKDQIGTDQDNNIQITIVRKED